MVSQRLKKHANELVYLQKARPCILKDHVMGIETYSSMVFSSMKQILNDVHDTDVFVVSIPKGRNTF
jgi:hypothetical protein